MLYYSKLETKYQFSYPEYFSYLVAQLSSHNLVCTLPCIPVSHPRSQEFLVFL